MGREFNRWEENRRIFWDLLIAIPSHRLSQHQNSARRPRGPASGGKVGAEATKHSAVLVPVAIWGSSGDHTENGWQSAFKSFQWRNNSSERPIFSVEFVLFDTQFGAPRRCFASACLAPGAMKALTKIRKGIAWH